MVDIISYIFSLMCLCTVLVLTIHGEDAASSQKTITRKCEMLFDLFSLDKAICNKVVKIIEGNYIVLVIHCHFLGIVLCL